VVGFSGLLHTTDITQFRSMFGLTGGSWTTVQVPGTYTCTDPGLTQLGYEEEAALDSEWAGAEAPGAAVELVACANLTAETEVQDIADLATPPKIITTSISDGCESQVGSAGLQFIVTVFQQAAAEGISIFDATSDSGADVCDQGLPAAVSGIQADSAASTPYDVAVGGLDFSDYYTASQGGAPESTYWSATNNSTTMGSALSYIPEMTWNSSCASELIYKEHGYTQSYGSTGFCNTATAADNYLQNTYAGGGAPSSFSKQPAWQSALGVPTADPASGSLSTNPRYLPDIAFFGGSAGDHAFAFCLTDNTGISSCSASSIVEGGGTSFTAPMMAGIQALINQAEGGGAQGNPNPIFYALAGTEYGSAGSSACNSSLGTSASSACIFYDITLGDKADILWRNSTSGDVYIWLMNGISIANQGGLGDITSD
jgi:subtilase family serine protease